MQYSGLDGVKKRSFLDLIRNKDQGKKIIFREGWKEENSIIFEDVKQMSRVIMNKLEVLEMVVNKKKYCISSF